MNSQEDCSEIEQENLTPIFPSINHKSANKYITFHEIKRYQSQKLPYNLSQHTNCMTQCFRWLKQNANDPANTFVIRNKPQEYLINHGISLCCFYLRFALIFGLKKGNKTEIIKVRKNGSIWMQEGVKYSVSIGMGVIKIQISITKEKQTKIWKQMQIPIRSHQPSATYTLILQQSPTGEISINLNDFQFVINLALPQIPQTFIMIKTENIIHRIQFQQTKMRDIQGGACNNNKCIIF